VRQAGTGRRAGVPAGRRPAVCQRAGRWPGALPAAVADERGRSLPRRAFRPPPRVDSVVLVVRRR